MKMNILFTNILFILCVTNLSFSQNQSKWIFFTESNDKYIQASPKFGYGVERFYYDNETLEKCDDSCIVWVKQTNFTKDVANLNAGLTEVICYEKIFRFVLFKSQNKYVLTYYKEKNCLGIISASDERETGYITPSEDSVISELFKVVYIN
jgi:hypothetical protein